MVDTLSLVGAAFAVGGSYFAVDSLRDVLIAKTISTAYATRLLIGGAAVIGGLTLVTRGAGAGAKETAKEELIAQIQAAAESVDTFAAEPEDPNYMVKSDIHKITESGLRMTVLMDEYPEADLPIWWKSKLSVAASGTDELADNLGYALANPESFDAEAVPDWSFEEELAVGTREELEHTDDREEAERIAREHLREDPDYYTKLAVVGLVKDERKPGVPDLWFAEDGVRQFTPQEAVEYLRSGDNCVWLIEYSDENYGDDEYPHYDYPIEDPDELETMVIEGVFDEGSPFHGTIIANGTSYDLDMWEDEPDGKHPSFVDWNESSDSRSRGPFTDKDAESSKNTAGLIWSKNKLGSDILVLRDNLNTGYVGYLWQFKNAYGTDNLDEIRRIVKSKDELERVPRWNSTKIGAKTISKIKKRKTPLPVDFNWDSQFKDAEAFSLSDRPVSVKFGPGTSGNAKMKAVFTDASGDTKTTQFGYRGMSDYTKNKDPARRDAYLARHGSKAQGENWKDPTTAGALSRWILWEKTSLSDAKSAFKKRFDLRAEGTESGMSPEDLGYQTSPFLTEAGRRAIWIYEPDYSIEDDDQ